jgi:hypothetical protein
VSAPESWLKGTSVNIEGLRAAIGYFAVEIKHVNLTPVSLDRSLYLANASRQTDNHAWWITRGHVDRQTLEGILYSAQAQ